MRVPEISLGYGLLAQNKHDLCRYYKYTERHKQTQYLPAYTVSFMVVPSVRAWEFRIDAPFLCQPASVEGITCYQTYGGDQYNNQRVHNKIPPRSKMIFPVYMDSKWKKKREKAIVLVCLETKKASSP